MISVSEKRKTHDELKMNIIAIKRLFFVRFSRHRCMLGELRRRTVQLVYIAQNSNIL